MLYPLPVTAATRLTALCRVGPACKWIEFLGGKTHLKCNHKLDDTKIEKDAIIQSNHYGNNTFSKHAIYPLWARCCCWLTRWEGRLFMPQSTGPCPGLFIHLAGVYWLHPPAKCRSGYHQFLEDPIGMSMGPMTNVQRHLQRKPSRVCGAR